MDLQQWQNDEHTVVQDNIIQWCSDNFRCFQPSPALTQWLWSRIFRSRVVRSFIFQPSQFCPSFSGPCNPVLGPLRFLVGLGCRRRRI